LSFTIRRMDPFNSTEARLAEAADDDYCYLTTTGRASGRAHEIEIWFAVDPVSGGTLYLLAGGGDTSDWVRNLRVDPAVTVRVRDVTYAAHARVVTAGDEDERARTLVFAKYQPRNGGELVSWRARALPVALDVEDVSKE
jgi:deazaflavin-dependent oxidoreductase (nitroreductase family)